MTILARPTPHAVHDDAFDDGIYRPAAQRSHDDAAAMLLAEPGTQDIQLKDGDPNSEENRPTPQEIHVLFDVAVTVVLYVPTPHRVHCELAALLYDPGAQLSHILRPE